MSASNKKEPTKVLIIEDEGDICLLLNIILKNEDLDLDLDHVKTLEKAKEYLDVENPVVIILDNRLPDGLGVDFIPYLRTHFPAIKICMISGYHAATAKDIALENGADVFLEKPFTKEQVYNAVKSLLVKSDNIPVVE
ncbi:MAG: response regulator [Ferruginibacter sp.]